MNRTQRERQLRDDQAEDYNSWYMKRGEIPVHVEDELIIQKLELEQDSRILDVGCGTGRLLRKIKSKYPSINFSGIDISKKSLAIAKRNIPDGNFKCHDISCTTGNDFTSVQYNRILSVQVLQHIEPKYHLNALRKIYDLLEREGLLVIELYNNTGIIRRFQQLKNKSLKKEVHQENFYEYRFNSQEVVNLLKKIDKDLKIKVYGCQSIPRSVLNRLPFLKTLDKWISNSFMGKYISYYFIIQAKKI